MQVVKIQGKVFVKKSGETERKPARLHDVYCPGDMIIVSERSRATLFMSNEATIHLDENTTTTFKGIEEKQTLLFRLLKGAMQIFSRNPKSLKVVTPFMNAGVEGTEFMIRVKDDRTLVTVYEGRVRADNEAGALTINSGESASAGEDAAPQTYTMVQPRDAVQWALYYPPVLHYRETDFSGESDWQAAVRSSIRHFWDGDISAAFASIEEVPNDVQDPRFYDYRASLLLTVGQVDEASKDIEQSLLLDPGNSLAAALQSVITLVQNKKEEALHIAQEAVDADPESAAVRIALSYAQQAAFDLRGALGSIQEAVKLESENSLAWARLAELRLSFNELDSALEAAQKAVELNPGLNRTQTVLGFSYLSRIKLDESVSAFNKAIKLDQADPMPRLGLGLAMIRKGKLGDGRKEIEIAASLDPGNSLVRSYLGKAYYEEKRDRLAKDQYSAAKELDPRDPTPFFYDAIREQSVNRPVEALHDMQKSIELNDNRSVYRSKLMIDEDLAARSASLARIYKDLGFQQLALVEGWKSLSTDPGSFSAHRFLADSYSALQRHEIARVSELLQSQLMQPISINPVQPHLAESNLIILDGAGPGDLSFNEFNPLFNRNQIALRLSGVIGENDTLGDEIVVSGIYNNVSISAGQFHFETDGYRRNNDLDEDIYNVFIQASLTHKTSILAEYRQTETKKGDLRLNFDPDDFRPDFRQDEETKSIRFGLRHSLTPGSDIIATFIYKDLDSSLNDVIELIPTVNVDLDISTDDEGYMAEVQHIWNLKLVHLIYGAGYFSSDFDETLTISSSSPEIEDADINHNNVYLYSHIKYPKNLIWTIGASGDFFDGRNDIDEDQFNPKFGFTWNPLPDTTVRAAVFRVLQRTLISEQTIEPTQVAGFNQFFEDAAGTDSWRYGAALDQKFTDNLYGGVEFSKRELEVPFLIEAVSPPPGPPPPGPPPPGPPPPGPPPPGPPPSPSALTVSTVETTDWDEYLGRAYINWTPHKYVALSAEYQYEKFDRDKNKEFVAGIADSETHHIPIGMNLFHPYGFLSKLKATYTKQTGTFQPTTGEAGTFVSGEDDFWIVDVLIGYRLPKRWGIITIEAKNLFDKSFKFQETDPVRPLIQPERSIFAKFTLAL
jgi:tetratricopeptide (TPR) repeat protein